MIKHHHTITLEVLQGTLVSSGRVDRAVRSISKHPVRKGDNLMICRWTGEAYNSPRAQILRTTVRLVSHITITPDALTIAGLRQGDRDEDILAYQCGFDTFAAMRTHYLNHHTPYTGILICW